MEFKFLLYSILEKQKSNPNTDLNEDEVTQTSSETLPSPQTLPLREEKKEFKPFKIYHWQVKSIQRLFSDMKRNGVLKKMDKSELTAQERTDLRTLLDWKGCWGTYIKGIYDEEKFHTNIPNYIISTSMHPLACVLFDHIESIYENEEYLERFDSENYLPTWKNHAALYKRPEIPNDVQVEEPKSPIQQGVSNMIEQELYMDSAEICKRQMIANEQEKKRFLEELKKAEELERERREAEEQEKKRLLEELKKSQEMERELREREERELKERNERDLAIVLKKLSEIPEFLSLPEELQINQATKVLQKAREKGEDINNLRIRLNLPVANVPTSEEKTKEIEPPQEPVSTEQETNKRKHDEITPSSEPDEEEENTTKRRQLEFAYIHRCLCHIVNEEEEPTKEEQIALAQKIVSYCNENQIKVDDIAEIRNRYVAGCFK